MAKYTVRSAKTVLRTKVFNVTQERVVIPAGVEVEKHLVRHRGAAVIMARKAQGQVLLIRQFRLPLRRDTWELPAGVVDKGETPLRAAKRELREETGYRARSWKKLFAFFPSPGFLRRNSNRLSCPATHCRRGGPGALRKNRDALVYVEGSSGDGSFGTDSRRENHAGTAPCGTVRSSPNDGAGR